MRTSDFDYVLPPGLIAQTPIEPRDKSRLLVLQRSDHSWKHRHFDDLPDLLRPGDVLVFNDTRVIPARLYGRKETGAKLEILLLQKLEPGIWQALVKPAKRVPCGTRLMVGDVTGTESGTGAEVIGEQDAGIRVLRFDDEKRLGGIGQVPLPPYIHEPLADPERYQTVYSRVEGSAAAPTAGLHFTPGLISRLETGGITCVYVTLHVGLDTFQPVHEEDPARHKIHREFGIIPAQSAGALRAAREEGRRIICVGTTSTRLIEAAADHCLNKNSPGFAGWVDLFITPGYQFQLTDILITNFHLPKTTLLMMVSAFAGREFILQSYEEAVRQAYRFYSFGDAMIVF